MFKEVISIVIFFNKYSHPLLPFVSFERARERASERERERASERERAREREQERESVSVCERARVS